MNPSNQSEFLPADSYSGINLCHHSSLVYSPEHVPECAGLASDLVEGNIKTIRSKFNIPLDVELVVPPADWDACSPPVGFGTIYVAQLLQGFRFSPPPFWSELINSYHISLSQINPISVFYITHFLYCCGRNFIKPSVELFSLFFQMKRSPQGRGFLVFTL